MASLPLQFENPANPEVHERTTGQEIVDAFGKDGLDAFCRRCWYWWYCFWYFSYFEKNNPAVKVYAVEANESAVLSGENLDHIKSKGFQLVLSQIL